MDLFFCLAFVVSNCEFVIFPLYPGWVWYLFVSISDLCTLTLFVLRVVIKILRIFEIELFKWPQSFIVIHTPYTTVVLNVNTVLKNMLS